MELCARVELAVDSGRLSVESGDAVGALAFELEKELLRRDADIEVCRLEVVRFEGDLQQQALDRLVAAAAARERRVIEQTRRVEDLTGLAAGPGPADGVPPEPAGVPAPEGPSEREVPTVEKRQPSIGFEAEDLVEDPQP